MDDQQMGDQLEQDSKEAIQAAQKTAQMAATAAKSTAKTGKAIVEASAKAGTGNFVGAAATVLKDRNLRIAIIAIFLVLAFLVVGCAMIIGTAITGAVDYIVRVFSENWTEAWEQSGIESAGNALWLYTVGFLQAGATTITEAAKQAISDGAEALFGQDKDPAQNEDNRDLFTAGKTNDDHDLPALEDNETNRELVKSTSMENDDYKVTLDSLITQESLTGDNGAIRKRLNMIEARLRQRGEQLAAQAVAGYEVSAGWDKLGVWVQSAIHNLFLFRGMNAMEKTIDTSAFQITDVQALKILCLYAIQHDCNIGNIDMWDLMRYCGWYDLEFAKLSDEEVHDQMTNLHRKNCIYIDGTEEHEESIYNTSSEVGVFEDDIADGEIQAGSSIQDVVQNVGGEIVLPEPYVTRWKGSFAPQWYRETVSTVEEKNRKYNDIQAKIDKAIDGGMEQEQYQFLVDMRDQYADFSDDKVMIEKTLSTNEDADVVEKEVNTELFENLKAFQPYGIIDKLYYASKATLNITRDGYETPTQDPDRDDDDVDEMTSDGNDDALHDAWEEARDYIGTVKAQFQSNGEHPQPVEVKRDANNHHSVTILNPTGGHTYNLNGASKYCAISGEPITFEIGLMPETEYTITEEWDEIVPVETTPTATDPFETTPPTDPFETGPVIASAEAEGSVSPLAVTTPTGATEPSAPQTQTVHHGPDPYCTFTTFPDAKNYKMFRLNAHLVVRFEARSVDSLIEELVGLWPGSLDDVVTGIMQVDAEGNETFVPGHYDEDGNFIEDTVESEDNTGGTGTGAETTPTAPFIVTTPEEPSTEPLTPAAEVATTPSEPPAETEPDAPPAPTQPLLTYAKDHGGNDLFLRYWTDTMTVDGASKEIDLERLQPYQVEAYKDMITALADEMGIDISGVFGGTASGNMDIVERAKKELALYNASGPESGGSDEWGELPPHDLWGRRYWAMAADAHGTSDGNRGRTDNWCACFVICCALMCGFVGDGKAWGDMGGTWPLTVEGLYNYMVDNGHANGYLAGTDYKPVPGDIVILMDSSESMAHTGIVIEVDSSSEEGEGLHQVTYIDGNAGSPSGVQKNHSDDYGIGSPVPGGQHIGGYLSPFYPVSALGGKPVYESINTDPDITPSLTAREIPMDTEGNLVLIAGLGRWREGQIPDAIRFFSDRYPQLFAIEGGGSSADELLAELQKYKDGDAGNQFVAKWNSIVTNKRDTFEAAQRDYIEKEMIPKYKSAGNFDWTKEEFRENLLLGIITTSEESRAVNLVLSKIAQAAGDKNISAKDLLAKLGEEVSPGVTKLDQIIQEGKASLWPTDDPSLQDKWAASIKALLTELTTRYTEYEDSMGDPNGTNEEKIFHFLRTQMNLGVAAACGVVANIEAESSFNPNANGDNGTSYGICQWHASRKTALINYCNDHGLDYQTLQGQLQFLKHELETEYGSMLNKLRSVPETKDGAYQAGAIWCEEFERPADVDVKKDQRGDRAREYYWPKHNKST